MEGEAYINYEKAPESWKTDDGEKFPSKKAFVNPVFDLKKRKFSGTILWDSPVYGDVRWDYTMIFSEDWRFINQGRLLLINKNGTETEMKFGRDLFYRLYV